MPLRFFLRVQKVDSTLDTTTATETKTVKKYIPKAIPMYGSITHDEAFIQKTINFVEVWFKTVIVIGAEVTSPTSLASTPAKK